MINFDEVRDAYVVKVDVKLNGKRVRKTKIIPSGMSIETAQRMEAMMLDGSFLLREHLQGCIDGQQEAKGHVYAVRNEYLPGIVKIGMTVGPVRTRVRNLSTAMPIDFEIVHEVWVKHAFIVEQSLHAHFSKLRINRNREFFKMAEEDVISALNVAHQLDGVDHQAIINSIR